MITFTKEIDQKFLLDTDLDTLFSDLEDFVNTVKLPTTDFEPAAVDQRLVYAPLEIWLAAEFSYPLTITNPLAGYYLIGESVLDHDTNLTEARNKGVNGQPVFLVAAYLSGANVKYDATVPSKFHIGRWNGSAWVILTTTTRTMGQANGEVRRIYNAMTNDHYITGVAGYVPMNHARDRGIVLLASFGGDVQNGPSNSSNRFAVFASDVSNFAMVEGMIMLSARENGF